MVQKLVEMMVAWKVVKLVELMVAMMVDLLEWRLVVDLV
jgi:hypothetical protein